MILSLPACLYIADTELANNLKNDEIQKKDHAHPGQLTYAHWVNCILDSRAIVRRHGLIPELSNASNLKEMFPPLSAIADHFKAKDKTKTKQACNDIIQCFYVPGKTDFLELYMYAYLSNSHSTTNLRPS